SCDDMYPSWRCLVLFFFQAEDGIRDFHVTGVQTCALPILIMSPSRATSSRFSPLRTLDRLDVAREGDMIEIRASARSFLHNQVQIGRASCRERVHDIEPAGSLDDRIMEDGESPHGSRRGIR